MADPTDPTRREYRMPFGTRLQDDGSTRFRLWAPAARTVDLWLDDLARGYPMTMNAEGWAEIITSHAPMGTRYRLGSTTTCSSRTRHLDFNLSLPFNPSRCSEDRLRPFVKRTGP
jgi:1,4-alpha-glucan branching enzyme